MTEPTCDSAGLYTHNEVTPAITVL